jgi:DNA-binding NarL/FixJ family response regulator
MNEGAAPGIVLSDDLIFTSKIVGAARARGLTLLAARSADALVELARRSPPACAIVDLDNPGLDLPGLIQALSGIVPRPRVVAYGPHVSAELLRDARAAGCDPVLPRSKFVEQLERDLPAWFGLARPD